MQTQQEGRTLSELEKPATVITRGATVADRGVMKFDLCRMADADQPAVGGASSRGVLLN